MPTVKPGTVSGFLPTPYIPKEGMCRLYRGGLVSGVLKDNAHTLAANGRGLTAC